MGDILSFPRPMPKDGGKARILARRELIGLAKQGAPVVEQDSLVMLRPDPEMPCDCA
ncbi:MAG: hypothetical protein NVV83_10415 [Afipia sp.]|nr:hypothetical protein [Afipia sp.]